MPQLGRNNPCPCGSGKKYKKCCMVKGKKENRHSGHKKDENIHTPTPTTRTTLLSICAIILVGGIIYFNALKAPFTFDDAIIRQTIETASLESGELAGSVTHIKMIKALLGQSRPTAFLSFYLDYYFGGDIPFGYHLTNLIIHLLSSITVFFLVRAALSLPVHGDRYKKTGVKLAAMTSLLFVSHPVQTQAVTFIVQRMAGIMAMFYMLSVLFYIKGRVADEARKKILFYVGSAFFAILAFGSKQNAAMLPFFIGLYEIYFFQGVDWRKIKKKLPVFLALLILPAILALVYTDFQFFSMLAQSYKERPFTMGQRVLTEFRVVVYYLSLLFYPDPSRLNLDYDFPFSTSLIIPPATVIGLAIILGLLAVSFYLVKRRPVISFCILWFFGNLVIESSIYPLDLVYEHRLYLPSVGFFLITAVVLIKLFRRAPEKFRGKVEMGVMGLIIMLLGWGTYKRNMVWGSEISLWEDVARKSPNKARSHNNLGKAYASAALADKTMGHLADKSIVEYKKAIKLNPRNFVAYDNLGQAYGRKGRPDEAIKACRKAVELNPNYLQAYNNLGVADNKVGKYAEAVKACLEALRIKPNYAKSYFNLGRGYEGKGEHYKAIDAFEKAWMLMPDDANIPYNIANSYFAGGLPDKAMGYYRKALKIDPGFIDVYYNIGVIYFNKGKYKESAEQYEKVLKIVPAYAPAYERLGLIYMEKFKNYELALYNFKKAAEFFINKKDARLANKRIMQIKQIISDR
jgi:tetratricopeptide (TPR) repeat protein